MCEFSFYESTGKEMNNIRHVDNILSTFLSKCIYIFELSYRIKGRKESHEWLNDIFLKEKEMVECK